MLNPLTFNAFVRSLDILLDISLKGELVLSSIMPEPSNPCVPLPCSWRKHLGQGSALVEMFSEVLPLTFI